MEMIEQRAASIADPQRVDDRRRRTTGEAVGEQRRSLRGMFR